MFHKGKTSLFTQKPEDKNKKSLAEKDLREEKQVMNNEKNFRLADFTSIKGTPCPCGTSKRAFVAPDNSVASMHVVEISQRSRVHYHKKMTEIYYVLEGEGHLEIDKDKIPLKPGVSVLIPPDSLHRAVGELKILNVPIPAFDPADEWFVD